MKKTYDLKGMIEEYQKGIYQTQKEITAKVFENTSIQTVIAYGTFVDAIATVARQGGLASKLERLTAYIGGKEPAHSETVTANNERISYNQTIEIMMKKDKERGVELKKGSYQLRIRNAKKRGELVEYRNGSEIEFEKTGFENFIKKFYSSKERIEKNKRKSTLEKRTKLNDILQYMTQNNVEFATAIRNFVVTERQMQGLRLAYHKHVTGQKQNEREQSHGQ